jgi:hypothetical protein
MVMLIFILLFIPAAAAAPEVTGITPATGLNTSTALITNMIGTGFVSGASVQLTPVNVIPVHQGSIQSGSGGALLNNPLGVFVSGNYVYVTSNTSNALEIVDTSNPASPIHAGSIVNGNGGALLDDPMGVFISGNFAYIASSGSDALEIVDISNPANPMHAGNIVNGSGGALLNGPYGVFLSGNYAYITSYNGNALEIVDVTNPLSPAHTGSITDGGGSVPCLSLPAGLYVSGNYVYVASHGSDVLEIVNVTDPTSPVHAGRLDDGGGVAPFLDNPYSLYISGNYAYVTSSHNNRFEIVDVTDPVNPAHKASIQDSAGGAFLNNPFCVFVAGKYAYIVSENSSALEIIDIGTIPAASVNVISPTNITGVFDLTGAAPGLYNVVVTNPDGSFGTLAGGFTVIGSTPTTPTPTATPTPTPTPTSTITPTWTPVRYDDSGPDSDPTPVPTQERRSRVTVNIGGSSSIYQANVTGTRISDLIITGSVSSEPGKDLLPAPGTVYEYTDLLPARYASIQEAVISGTVPQGWLNGHHLTPQDVVIHHLSNSTWTLLPTTLVKSEGGRSYYTAVSPGLGRFAITGDTNESAVPLVMGQETPQGTKDLVEVSVTQVVPTLSRTPEVMQTTEVPAQPATQPSAGFSSLTLVAAIFGIIILIGLALVVRRRKSDL